MDTSMQFKGRLTGLLVPILRLWDLCNVLKLNEVDDGVIVGIIKDDKQLCSRERERLIRNRGGLAPNFLKAIAVIDATHALRLTEVVHVSH